MIPRRFFGFAVAAFAAAASLFAQPLARVAATSLRLPASPPGVNYATERVFSGLSFQQPVAVVTPPGESRRLFVVEKPGRIWVIPDVTAPNPTRTLFLDITSRVTVLNDDPRDERGLLALAFHPNYAANGQFFVYYTLTTTSGTGSEARTGLHDRLARFRVSSDPNVADPNSEEPLFSQFDEARNHNGGELLFGPDGYLYLSLGDEGGANDQYQNGQRIDRDFFAAVLRIDVDRRPGSLAPSPHPAVHPGSYAIPPDNPWVGATTFNGLPVNPASVRTEFWAIGLRNPWRMSFDSLTGRLWLADVGQEQIEEINLIVRGGNYGWSLREASQRFLNRQAPAGASLIDPVWEYPHTEGQAVTGGLLVRSPKYPALHGRYLFADFGSGRIWAMKPDDANPASRVPSANVQLLATNSGISSFGLNPATGDILLTDFFEGAIKRLVANPAPNATPLPATLSATGAFADLATLTPAPGVVSYAPNVSFWSDHAVKRRWFALTDTISTYGFSRDGAWTLPTGAVWVKHFDLELIQGNPDTARRIETRFLVKTADGVHGLTYRWNDAQTDATLVPDEGAEQNFTVMENGVSRTQTWRFPGRAECLMCHTTAGGHALSFNTRQLNRDHPFPGGSANIVAALAAAGYLSSAPADMAGQPALAPASDTSASLEHRARSYLDANCAQCHQPGGPSLGSWDARASTPLTIANIINGPLIDHGGDPANRVIVPRDPAHSRLLARLSTRGPGQMPPIASRERDLAGEELITAWIRSLSDQNTAPSNAGRLVNLSVRAPSGTNENLLTIGFVISPGASKQVLVRGIGPALAAPPFDLTGALANPTLSIIGPHPATAQVAANDDWLATDAPRFQQAGAFALTPGSRDAAVFTSLAPGIYNALIAGANNSTGLALGEIYDADPDSSPARLSNIAVRARVSAGDGVLIAGFAIRGAAKTILVRGVGPGLVPLGVSGALPQPRLTVFSGAQTIAVNNGWNLATNAAELRTTAARVGAFPLAENSRDAALLLTLPAGSYTVQIASETNASGVALIELYEVP